MMIKPYTCRFILDSLFSLSSPQNPHWQPVWQLCPVCTLNFTVPTSLGGECTVHCTVYTHLLLTNASHCIAMYAALYSIMHNTLHCLWHCQSEWLEKLPPAVTTTALPLSQLLIQSFSLQSLTQHKLHDT